MSTVLPVQQLDTLGLEKTEVSLITGRHLPVRSFRISDGNTTRGGNEMKRNLILGLVLFAVAFGARDALANRYYSPDLGRFVSRDPIGYEGGSLGLYEYVKSKPAMATDPRGLGPPLFPGEDYELCGDEDVKECPGIVAQPEGKDCPKNFKGDLICIDCKKDWDGKCPEQTGTPTVYKIKGKDCSFKVTFGGGNCKKCKSEHEYDWEEVKEK